MNITIPLTPRSKKNSQEIVFNKKTGHRMVIQNKRYTEFEKECKKYLPILDAPIDYPINLQCKFYVNDARKRDIANFIEAIQDILTKYGIFKDDDYTIVSSLDGCSMQVDREMPRVEIEITKKND